MRSPRATARFLVTVARRGQSWPLAVAIVLLMLPAIGLRALSGGSTAGVPHAPQGGLLYFVNTSSDTVVIGACQNGNAGCSLRGAIQTANSHPGADGISIDLPTSDPSYNGIFWTINLSQALPALTEGVDISGPGPDKLVVRRNSGGDYRIFNVTTTGIVFFSGMTIREGKGTGFGANSSGAGIANSNASGTVHVTNCALLANTATLIGGGVYNTGILTLVNCTLSGNSTTGGEGGGIYSTGSLTVTGCVLNSNAAQDQGGGIYSSGSSAIVTNCVLSSNSSHPAATNFIDDVVGGGLFLNSGTATLSNCTLSGNSASGQMGRGLGGGIYLKSGTINITGCTLVSNSIAGSGAAPSTLGAGIFNEGGTVNITNSTLTQNFGPTQSLSDGGGIYNDNTLNVTNCTLSGNTARRGGGIFNNAGDTASIKSSIIASNTAITAGPDLNGAFTPQGFNLIGKNDGATGFPVGNPNGNNDIVGTSASPVDPKLDPNGLQNNGGPTQTVALQADSPAIDKGTSNGSTGHLTTDQRGVGYQRAIDNPAVPNATGGDGTDVGAFEFGAHIDAVSRKMHGAFVGNISLPLIGPTLGIECRTGGATDDHQVIMTFPSAVSLTSASVTAGTGSVSNFSVTGAQVTVNLTGVANAQTITITLNNVSDGTNTGNVSVPMGVLLGDTTGNGTVNASDVSLTKLKSGQPVDASNFREDVTVSNSINSSDVSLVKSKSGTALPP